MSRGGFPRNPRKHEGGWINLAIMGASAALNYLQQDDAADNAEDAANRASQSELALRERGVELAERQDERAGDLFQHYQDVYQPREAELVEEAFDRPLTPARAEAEATADVRSSLDTARQIGDRNLRRRGVNPASGAAVGLERMRGLEGAKLEAGARTRARRRTRDYNFGRKAQVLGYGSPGAAGPYGSSAQAGLGDAAAGAAGRSRRMDSFAYEAGANRGAATADLIDTGLDAWTQYRGSRGGPPMPTVTWDRPDEYGLSTVNVRS